MNQPARFTETLDGVVVDRLAIRDADVAREARRWTQGTRGPVVDDEAALTGADLSEFVTEALKIGAHALTATGQALESQALERMIREVGEKTAASTNTAVAETSRVVSEASASMNKTAAEVRPQLAGMQRRSGCRRRAPPRPPGACSPKPRPRSAARSRPTRVSAPPESSGRPVAQWHRWAPLPNRPREGHVMTWNTRRDRVRNYIGVIPSVLLTNVLIPRALSSIGRAPDF